MGIAAGGTLIGWSFTASYWLFQADKRVVYGLLATAVFFTAVLALHVAGYRRRRKRAASTGSDPA